MGHTPLIDFCNQCDLRARPCDRPNLAHRARGRPRAQLFFASGSAPCGAWPTENSRARGLVARREPSVAFLEAIARYESFAPTRSNSNTRCREIVTARLERPLPSGTKEFEVPATSSPGARAPAFANARTRRVASRAPPRRGSRFALPEVLSLGEWPLSGQDPRPQTVPSLWSAGPTPFRSSTKRSVDDATFGTTTRLRIEALRP